MPPKKWIGPDFVVDGQTWGAKGSVGGACVNSLQGNISNGRECIRMRLDTSTQ